MRPHNWISMVGEHVFSGDKLTFKGGANEIAGHETPYAGYFICDLEFGGGTVQSTITFEEYAPTSIAGVILYFHAASNAFVTAQLGGASLVSVQTFGGQEWTVHAAQGPSSQLKSGHSYHLRAQVTGSRVRMDLDGIQVLDAVLPFALPHGQTGIWAKGLFNISFSDYDVEPEVPKLFVIMQFSAPFDELYSDVIKPVAEDHGFTVARADDTYGPGIIIADIEQSILEAKAVIADITPLHNPNVFWEVGYAHALRKPLILLAERDTVLPFDVSPFRTLFYV